MSSERAHGGDAGDSETRSPYSPASWDGATTDSADRLPAGTEAEEPSAAEATPDVTVPNKGADEGDDAEAAEPTVDSLATHPDSVEDVGPGRRLGIDVGGVRVGVAMSDPAPVLATPVETVRRDRRKGTDLRRVARLVSEYEIVEVIIGLPVTMGGEHGHAAEMARGFAGALAPRITPVPVRFSDERLTTVTASRMLFERGVRGKQQRSVVDQAAAVEILQSWLDARGRGAGKDCW